MPDRAIKITDAYTKGVMARAIPDTEFDRETKHWVLPAEKLTPRAAAVALKLFPHLALEYPELEDEREKLISDVRPFDNATPFDTRIVAPTVEEILAAEGKQLFNFQALDLGYGAAILREHGGFYLGWERGMGKTLGSMCLAEGLDTKYVLAVVPNTAKVPVWQPELEQYVGSRYDHIFVLPNQKKRREWVMDRVKTAKDEDKSLILVVHYQALAIIGGKSGRGWDKYGEWDLIIADEVHRIKNPKAKMTRSLKKIPTRMKLGLSGSIIQNHAEELFSPLQWLYPDRYKSKWRDWNDRYLDYVEGGYSKVFVGILPDKLDELRQELGVIMVYRRKEDELDLPERIDEDRHIELSDGQRKVYDQLVGTCMAELDTGDFVAADDGLPMLIKLRQVATGLDLLGDVNDSTKLDTAAEMIEDNQDEYFVVFSWFKAACTALQERLGEQALVITGDVRQDKRDPIIEEFKDPGNDKRILICTISTMGESQNFQVANNAIFLDRSWNPSDNTQAEDRIYRMGQEKKVTITHLIAKDTVDEHRVTPTIANKESLRRLILGG